MQIVSAYVYGGRLLSVDEIKGNWLTHINYAFAVIRDGEIVHLFNQENLNVLKKVKRLYPHIKLIISVGGWGADGFSDAAFTESGRMKFAKTVAHFIKENDFDGVDLDWEYPSSDMAGIKARKEDKENFTLILREIRKALKELELEKQRPLLLTIAAGAEPWYLDGVDLKDIEPILDYMNLMTYDFYNGWSKKTGHHTNLFTPAHRPEDNSIDKAVKLFTDQGFPKHKLAIGAGFYGRGLRSVKATGNDILYADGSENFDVGYSTLVKDYIHKNGFKRYWDDSAKAPYLYDGDVFITYDDEESIFLKGQYVAKEQLGG
ncbi:glycoside hydrolase family 18 protein [Lederbergia citri]|uniref:chitinase n=1 Tax=Lederbergia citri TaxID=2833580 RepID=A0A942TEQ5_9BACI|nr:glycoside hydrolase family 18 protein [Lederbergia citri]MBS4196285.1 glycoside hydrolase family 18 protein [Lederbergia citri]